MSCGFDGKCYSCNADYVCGAICKCGDRCSCTPKVQEFKSQKDLEAQECDKLCMGGQFCTDDTCGRWHTSVCKMPSVAAVMYQLDKVKADFLVTRSDFGDEIAEVPARYHIILDSMKRDNDDGLWSEQIRIIESFMIDLSEIGHSYLEKRAMGTIKGMCVGFGI